MLKLPNTQFTFHNAGQGLFYSGHVNGFEFVYDCGSVRKDHLNGVVSNYKATLPNGKLNLLILSHLHEDHVSGLYSLFHRNPKISVERVILPYLSPIERLLLAIGSPAPDTGDWFYNFLLDPVQFFIERGVQRITYLGRGMPDGQTENPDARDNEQTETFTDKLTDSIELRNTIFNNEPQLRHIPPKNLQIKSHDGAIIANSIYWQFRFFNYKVQEEKLHSFYHSVQSIIHGKTISEIIGDPQEREKLRYCYKSLNKTDFNNTSLLVFHGPLYSHGYIPSNRQAQLLTGDIDLKRHLLEISKHFGSSLSDVSLCLIPHHGSRRNWDKAILPYLSPRCTWVVSTGITNKTQPCLDILNDIKGYGHKYSICNDNSSVTF